ncbi:heterokaryon incompatibility protein-domain-containing protein [Cladorrhinum sp. PSN259]|nr:heterokaryon incompatibility protein-domain-containing protein [Cladorrhinum sp. PSN259]
MLCRICQTTIFDSEQRWGYHREDYHNVVKDPEVRNCTFCSNLRIGAGKNEFPKYQWTRRSLPTTRGDQPSMVVTFRPVDEHLQQDSSPEEIKHSGARRFASPRVFYLFKKDTIQVAADLGPTTDIVPDGSLSQIQKWMRECTLNHPKCQAVRARNLKEPYVPTRLVDVSSDRIHIVESQKAGLKPTEPYVTLSHCWGKLSIIRLIEENVPKLLDPKVGIEWDELTNTFRDAITVTRELGIKYIWIDSLCIIQASSKTSHGDFHEQGQLMHKVYRKSFCNIAAADSEDGKGGLFRPRLEDRKKGTTSLDRQDILPKPVELKGGDLEGEWYMLLGDSWSAHLLDKILYTRGWVFQERMLAPRLVHFSEKQVLWDCATLSASECLPEGLPAQLDTKSATERHWRERLSLIREKVIEGDVKEMRAGTADDSLEAFWRESVRNYTRCELTSYVADRLKAIWGVAKLVRDGLREEDQDAEGGGVEEYGSGLWRKNLYMQLAWRVVNPGLAEKVRPHDLGELHPSWSWASTIGEIELQPRMRSAMEEWYRVKNHRGGEVEFEVKPDDKVDLHPHSGTKILMDLQPELVSNSLAVKGTVVKGYWSKNEQMVRSPAFTQDLLDNMDFFPDVVLQEEQICYLLVLWSKRNTHGGEIVDDREQEQFSDCSDDEEELQLPQQEQVIHYSGAGLVLLSEIDHEETGRFKRIGAFRFHGLHKEEVGLLLDEEREKEIWIL